MKTTNHKGTPDACGRSRLPGRRRWPAAGALAAALLGLMLATACSSGPAMSGAAAAGTAVSAGGTAASDTVAGQLLLRGDRDLVNYTRCMRAHGVPMRDPYHQPGHVGLTVDTPPQSAVTRTASAACNHYMQDLLQVKEARTTALASAELAGLTRYAVCMRAHDINMLDPTPRGELDLGDVAGMAHNDFGRTSPQFHAADAACRHLLPAGVTDDGTGP